MATVTEKPSVEDPFDQLMNLEEMYFAEGHSSGQHDGVRAGKAEGRLLGMQHGFERFVEMGRLQGQATVWDSHLRKHENRDQTERETDATVSVSADGLIKDDADLQDFWSLGVTKAAEHSGLGHAVAGGQLRVRTVTSNARLKRHVSLLYGLTEPESLSFENQKAGVEEFESRLKRAQAEFEIIRNSIRDDASTRASDKTQTGTRSHKSSEQATRKAVKSTDIEDMDFSRFINRGSAA